VSERERERGGREKGREGRGKAGEREGGGRERKNAFACVVRNRLMHDQLIAIVVFLT